MTTKLYKLEVYVIDFERNSRDENIIQLLENNKHISVQVKDVASVDLGEWSDEHPLNQPETSSLADYRSYFQHLDISKLSNDLEYFQNKIIEISGIPDTYRTRNDQHGFNHTKDILARQEEKLSKSQTRNIRDDQ